MAETTSIQAEGDAPMPAPAREDAQAQPVGAVLEPAAPDAFLSIPINVEIVLATTRMPVARLLDIAPGAELDIDAGMSGDVALMANGTVFAHGALFIMDAASQSVGLRITRMARRAGPEAA